jgi:tRNA(Ile)-lysidine synthase
MHKKMQPNLENIVMDFAKSGRLLPAGQRVVLAISGGADSLALMCVLHSLKMAGLLEVELSVAHVNHQLRGAAADADEKFVVDRAHRLNLPVTVRRIDVYGFARENKLSIETAARKLRIQALLEIAQTTGFSLIATAHHRNDNAETVVHRLLRGTGFRGLAGIRPRTDFPGSPAFVRPMLCATREQIVQYLREKKIDWRQDHTNQDLSYTRNYIRHILLPQLQKECAGSLIEHLSELAKNSRRFYDLLCRRIEKLWPEVTVSREKNAIVLNRQIFKTQPEHVKVELARYCLTEIGSGERDLTARHYNKIIQLACGDVTGREIMLPNGFRVRTEYGSLIFEKLSSERLQVQRQSVSLEIPGQTQFADYRIEARIIDAQGFNLEKFKKSKTDYIEWFDLDRIHLPLVARPRQVGDRFWPIGLPGKKRVGKFVSAARLSRQLRDGIFVIADEEKIIWLVPVRACEETKLTTLTKKVLQLQLIPSR